MDNKKAFRPTPARFQNSLKILSGTKTNATIRDLEEDEDELEEKTGVVVSIARDRVNGSGWTVKDDEGNLYNCSCASSMYELPSTTERGGMLYPDGKVTVKFTVNPVLRINTITEIVSLGEGEEEKLDISKWQHKDNATTVIAKPKSAISISDSKISFNYDNVNEVTADEKSVDIKGEETNIKTDKVNIDSEEINIQGINIDKFVTDVTQGHNLALSKMTSYTGGVTPKDASSVYLTQERNVVSATIEGEDIELYEDERVMADVKDQQKHPLREQKFILLTDKGMDEIHCYPDGLITFKANNEPGKKRNILSTHNWLAPQFDNRNTITSTASKNCSCCTEIINGQTFIDYCPVCNKWHVLSQIQNNIICNACSATFCAACGHYDSLPCFDKEFDLKLYDKHNIIIVGNYCEYCNQRMEEGHKKEYVNYCPHCKKWNFLSNETKDFGSKIINILHCNYCHQEYCSNCGSQQNDHEPQSFSNNIIYHKDYIEQNKKLFFIKEQ